MESAFAVEVGHGKLHHEGKRAPPQEGCGWRGRVHNADLLFNSLVTKIFYDAEKDYTMIVMSSEDSEENLIGKMSGHLHGNLDQDGLPELQHIWVGRDRIISFCTLIFLSVTDLEKPIDDLKPEDREIVMDVLQGSMENAIRDLGEKLEKRFVESGAIRDILPGS